LRRLLVMVPWVMERGEVTVAEVAERFQLTEKEVINDLERVAMCGVPPYGPDDLVDLFVDEGVVYAGAARIFTKPLRLSTPEGFALLAAGRAGLELPGAEPGGALARALDKLEQKLGAPDVDVTTSKPALTDEVAAAVEDRAQLRLTYWSAANDQVTERIVDPQAVFSDRGNWYLLADDVGAKGERTFRIDRIEHMERTGEGTTPRSVSIPAGVRWFADDPMDEVTLRIAPEASWLLTRYPSRSITEQADGSFEMVLAVTSERWLARLLLRVPQGVMVISPERWQQLRRTTAADVLARYRRPT
jgi:proteasome accessory factor C